MTVAAVCVTVGNVVIVQTVIANVQIAVANVANVAMLV